MSQVLGEELPAVRSGVISGPHLAREVVRRGITATVIASADPEVRAPVQSLLRLGGRSLNSAKPGQAVAALAGYAAEESPVEVDVEVCTAEGDQVLGAANAQNRLRARDRAGFARAGRVDDGQRPRRVRAFP